MKADVVWSDRLEYMAEGLFRMWESSSSNDPFSRTCVVVGDMSTRNWLKRYFLFHRGHGSRRILANVDFKPIAEFVNDWLAAQTSDGGSAGVRSPSDHPYAKGILAWRIDAILRSHAKDPNLKVLASYIEGRDASVAARRRHELATRLAELYDDYLGGRFQMLAGWERGDLPAGADRWQGYLYRLLVDEVPETYTRDYVKALSPDADLETAFENGFTRYEAVHVFDVATAPWPYIEMLKKISAATPVTFWNFNPSKEYWLDDPTKRAAMRDMARRIRTALMNGETPPEAEQEDMFGTPDMKLIGALAGGARGVLSEELDIDGNGCRWAGAEGASDFDALRSTNPEVHVCHSPRRELEVARDALHRFFKGHPDARPCDAQILCADWGNYAPLVESVFAYGGAGSMPVSVDGADQQESPIAHSLGDLLLFRNNRFGVNAVFALLGVPEIRDRFGIDTDGLSVLREMVKACNIHWGYDDADVRAILGKDCVDESCPFTWRHGLDRMALDALLGPRRDERNLVDAGKLGRLQPHGSVEEERARLVGRLNAFVTALAELRAFMRSDHLPETWGKRLLQAIDDFYSAKGDSENEVSRLRMAVNSVAHDAAKACEFARVEPRAIPGDVFCRAVTDAVGHGAGHASNAGDAVRIAPLSIGTAVPARFVWICGLSDGVFPRCDNRPSFDLVGRHPTIFDVTTRERDALALLKAAMGAREQLAFSYVGRNIQTNEKMPASVPLIDLMDWFKSSGVELKEYEHPLQSFSPRYFLPSGKSGPALPPNYSRTDRDAAVAIDSRTGGRQETEAALPEVVPFPPAESGDTVIDVEDLVDFYSRPNHFIAKERLGIRMSKPEYELLNDEDDVAAKLPNDIAFDLSVAGPGAFDLDVEAERLREEGCSADVGEIKAAMQETIDGTEEFRERRLDYKKASREGFACEDKTLTEALTDFRENGRPVSYHVNLSADGKPVVVNGLRREIELNVVPSGRVAHVFDWSTWSKIYPSQFASAWIRHVAGHAAGGRFVSVIVCAYGNTRTASTLRPFASKDEAAAKLEKIVKRAMSPVPFDIDAARGKDVDPFDVFGEVLSMPDDMLVKTQQPRQPRK